MNEHEFERKARVGFQLATTRQKKKKSHLQLCCKLLISNKLEAEVGIDRVSSSTSHSKSIVYGIADCLTINELR